MAITKEDIIAASIQILNREGFDALTMRTIAKELDIKAASLYWHIKGKLELYGEIAESLCSQYPMPALEGTDVKSFLVETHKAFRTLLLSTRDAVPVFENSVPTTPRRLDLIKSTLDALSRMGVADSHLVTTGNLLNNYVLSFVADEIRFKNTPEELFDDFSQVLGWADGRLFANMDYDAQFLYGLRVLLAGIEATLTNT